MTVPVNGTHAKDITLHFLKAAQQPITKRSMAQGIQLTKTMLANGYSKDDIIRVIDHVVERTANVYSMGYITRCIEDTLDELRAVDEAESRKREADSLVKQNESEIAKLRDEVVNDESTQRNRRKAANRAELQSRLGKKFDFDMFEG